MKKEYTAPEIEAIKINSAEPSAAFANGSFNSANIAVKPDVNALNIINF